jgi:hypothetical protein
MTTLYKITTKYDTTFNRTQWGECVTNTVQLRDTYKLCSHHVLHAYASPAMAVIMDPAHMCLLPNGKLWKCDGDVVINDGTKIGCTSLTTLHEIPIPKISHEEYVTIAISCTKHICTDRVWLSWADNWLDGMDRNIHTARLLLNGNHTLEYYALAATQSALSLKSTKHECSHWAASCLSNIAAALNTKINYGDNNVDVSFIEKTVSECIKR